MSLVQSSIMGILQGLTEFLPVSSSGHLVVLKRLMNLEEVPMLYDVLLHLATLLVVLVVFRERVGKIILSLLRWGSGKKVADDRENLRLFWVIVVATFFTGVLGIGIESFNPGGNIKLVSLLFIATGLILWFSGSMKGKVKYNEIGVKHGIITGIAQGLGVFPGISRSGITISAALLSGMDREKAGEYSFLISIPAILGALLLKLKEMDSLLAGMGGLEIVVGFSFSFLSGLFSLLLLLKLVRRGRLSYFSFYLVPLGLLGLFFL